MKNTRILLLVFCVLLMALTGTAGAQQTIVAQPCVCLDANGIRYPEGTPGTTFCYQYDLNKVLYLSETLTLQQCTAMNTAYAQQQEQLRILQEQQQKEEAERQRLAAEEAERQRLAAEEAERQRLAAEEAERQRLAEEEAERQRLAEEEAERQRLAAEEAERQRLAEEEAERQRLAEEEAERQRLAEEEAERQRLAEEEAERQRLAEEEAERQRLAEEEAERQRFAAEEAERQRLAEEEAERQRLAAEEAERQRLAEEEAERQRLAAEEAERQRLAEEEAERQRLAAEEAERQRLAEEEAERQRLAAEEAERQRLAAEEAERQRLAEEEVERQRLAAEEAERQRLAEEEAERQRLAEEEAERQRLVAEGAERQRLAEEEAERQRLAEEEAERQRLAAEEAERQRLAEEVNQELQQDVSLMLQSSLLNQQSDGLFANADNLQLENNDVETTGNPETSGIAQNADNNESIPEVILPTEVTEVTETEPDPTDVTPTVEATEAETAPTEVTPTADVTETESVLTEVTPTADVTETEPVPTEVTPTAEATETESDPTEVTPTADVTETEFVPTDVTPTADVTETEPVPTEVIPTADVTETESIPTDVTPAADATEAEPEPTDVTPAVEAAEAETAPTAVTPTVEVAETEPDPTEVTPAAEATETETAPTAVTLTAEATETEPVQTAVTPTAEATKEIVHKYELSETASAELSQLLTKDEMENLESVITEDWLTMHVKKLSEKTFAELKALFSSNTLLKKLGPEISIEGDLKSILLSTPNGGTVTTANVPFVWLYDYDTGSGTSEVIFILELTIKSGADMAAFTTTVSSASCANRICTYTANLSAYKNAKISWTVSGSYNDGGSYIVIPAPAPQTFTLKVPDPTPTSTPTPTPTPKPLPKPKAPVQECPVGRYIIRNLGFYWAPSEFAESYTVEWWNDRGQKGKLELSNSDVTCQNNRCIINTSLPGIGNYAWTVTAKNKSGSARSGEMRFEIDTNITTPQPYHPDGTIGNHNYPAFEWEDVRDGAVGYRIQVVGKYDNRIRMDRWFKVEDIYVGQGVCYVQTDLFLPAGSYSWRVQARNKDFPSGWSSWRDFYVECDYCNYGTAYYSTYVNTVPSCSFPAGTITVNKPDFQWRTLTGAAYYIVKLQDSTGNTLFEKQASNSNCTIELCTWSPDYTFTKNGNYTWSVAGYGGNGALWNIAYGSFSYQGQVTMKPISYLRPAQNGYLSNEVPVIVWTDPGEAAALFHVEIFSSTNTSLFTADLNREQAWCDGNTCSIEFKTIPDAKDYRIAVTPYSELNTKGDTVSLTFSKGGMTLKLSSPKEGAVVSSRPLFRWPLDNAQGTQYDLILTDSKNNVTTISPLVCGAVGVTCEEGEVFFSPAEPLAPGAYTVKLSAPGLNAQSEAVNITVK